MLVEVVVTYKTRTTSSYIITLSLQSNISLN